MKGVAMNRIRTKLLAAAVMLAAVLAGPAERVSSDDPLVTLPLPVPERPFLLVEATRRYLPSEIASVRVQHAGEAELGVAVLRVHDPVALLAAGRELQGLAIATTPLGQESEALIAASGRLPRAGNGLTLIAQRNERLRRLPARARVARSDESSLYDSYSDDESDAETWGVESGGWADAELPLGRLPAGLYLVRVTSGAWAGSTLLSVGSLALMVRRGDAHDEIRVLGPDGGGREGIRVEAREGSSVVAAGTTDAEGALRLPPSDRPGLRFLAISGAAGAAGGDITWADVAHARLPACDPRVYLGTGRPVFRNGETIHLRGHVRGCDESGREGPLAGETIELGPSRDGAPVSVQSDAGGNFVAELVAAGTIVRARVRGRDSVRDIQIDSRQLPDRALRVRIDRDWAAAGERVTVEIADDEGGWPQATTVQVRTPVGVVRAPIGPGLPAIVSFAMPPSGEVLERAEIVATLTSPGRVQTARAELWTGRRSEIVELEAARTWGRSGESIPVRILASDLGGGPRPGPVRVSIRGSDGNGARGPERWHLDAATDPSGALLADIPLRGAGPWWLEARRGASVASLVVRDRPGPPALSSRGELALRPVRDSVDPGTAVDVEVRIEAGGTAWVTLEQGSVWASRVVRAPPGGGIARVALEVPANARGLASLVATEVRGAQLRSASATVEVQTSRRFELTASSDRRSYAEGQTAHVVLEARDAANAPRDAVVSVWMADAGYWELGEERYPRADDFFRLPGRPASAGDGSRPIAYGAEEGRHVDAWIAWEGVRLERATFRHAWTFGGRFVRVDKRGTLGEIAGDLARAAGLRGAEVCEEASDAIGMVHVQVRDLPWDLAALRLHERIEVALEGSETMVLEPFVDSGVLHYDCPVDGGGAGSGMGSFGGRGSGIPRIRTGAASYSAIREERLEGTLFFLGLAALGPDGRLELDIPLPAHPGRWRIEALAIASDGGGASANAVVHTTRALAASVRAPSHLRVGDETSAEIEIIAPTLAGREVEIEVVLARGLEVIGALPTRATLDARGHASLPLRVRADHEALSAIEITARVGGELDRLRAPITIAGSATSQPIALRSVVGPGATEVHLPLPPILQTATLRVRVGSDLSASIRDQLEELHAPRWDVPTLRLDRLSALAALRRAAMTLHGALGSEAAAIAADLERAIQGEAAAILDDIDADVGSDGGVSCWHCGERDPAMTAELVWGLWPHAGGSSLVAGLGSAVEALDRAAVDGRVTAGSAPVVAAALARAGRTERARALLSGAALGDLDAMVWAARAASALGDPVAPYGARIATTVRERLGATGVDAGCRGPTWFLCLARGSERAELARAAEALVSSGYPGARALAAEVATRIAQSPTETAWWSWGDSESDVLALLAAITGAGGERTRATVLRGGREIGSVDGEGLISIAAGSGDIVIRFARESGAFATVRVDGSIEVAPEDAASGSVPLERGIVEDGGERFVEIELTLARDARDLSITAPLPAGLELSMRAGGGQLGVRASGRTWNWWTGNPDLGPEIPALTRSTEGIQLDWRALRAGRYTVRIPVIATASGSFTAGAAVLRARDAGTWGLTRPLSVSW